jgi:quercetin dioxygenase-like cupin family protein
MAVKQANDATTHEIHGSTFRSYVTSADGSALSAWELQVPPATTGVPHRPDKDEVFRILEGAMRATVNGDATQVTAGDVLLVRAGDALQLDTGDDSVRVWVTTTAGLTATLADGATMSPPWAQ